MKYLRIPVFLIGFILAWEVLVNVLGLPDFMLPGPGAVASVWIERSETILRHAVPTAIEIVVGLFLGTLLGAMAALTMTYFKGLRTWMLPVLVMSQAIPVFALAPLLVLWLGYGMASKNAMATLIIFFPVTAAFYDGLRRTETGWLELAQTMNASAWTVLWHIRIPAALPSFGSGLRVAAAVAPIGAVVGEWVGSSEGLGFLMLHANAKLQVDLMFAALATLAVFAVTLYFAIDQLARRLTPWVPDDLAPSQHSKIHTR